MLNRVKKGDWVKGFHKGYFEVVGFGENYAFRDEEYYRKGDKISTMVNLKQGFSENMRFKLGADSVAEEWVFPVSKDIRDKIDLYWKENPKDRKKYDSFQAIEQLGDLWYQISITEQGAEFWQSEINKLPKKINQEQFMSWFEKRDMECRKFYEDNSNRKKNKMYFISVKLIKESIEKGKVPLYECPKLIFGK